MFDVSKYFMQIHNIIQGYFARLKNLCDEVTKSPETFTPDFFRIAFRLPPFLNKIIKLCSNMGVWSDNVLVKFKREKSHKPLLLECQII